MVVVIMVVEEVVVVIYFYVPGFIAYNSRHMRAGSSDFITQASTLEDPVSLESHPAILCPDRTVIREFLCLRKM